MADSTLTSPNAITYPLEDIVGKVFEGGVRIPDFQRSFRWQWEDVRRLFESIVRGYPIGSLLLWSRPAKEAKLSLGALTIDAPQTSEALWVVDGQQRLTSLASALSDAGSRDTQFALVYDLAKGTFTKSTNDEPHRVPLPVIFDLQKLLRWLSEHPESNDYFDNATRIAKAIRQYSIPAYIVKQQDEGVLRDIFDRMNNYGKRLTRPEVFSALHASEGTHGPPRTLEDIVDHLDTRFGFGELEGDTVLQAVLARRGPDVTRDIRAEFSSERVSREFPDETRDEAYRKGEDALGLAVAFLQQDAGIPHLGFLTYRYLLVILARFFGHHPTPLKRNRKLMRRWFWRAALVGPGSFSGSTPAMRVLGSQIRPGDEDRSVQSLLKSLEPYRIQVQTVEHFRSTAASSRMLLCALWGLRPRSVLTGECYEQSAIASALEGRRTANDIVHTLLRRDAGEQRSHAANRILLLGDDTVEDARNRFANPPIDIPPTTWTTVLESHALDARLSKLLGSGQYGEFLEARGSKLNGLTRAFLMAQTEIQFEDTPPLDALDLDDAVAEEATDDDDA